MASRSKPSVPASAANLTEDEIAEIDPDYFDFLHHVQLVGDADKLEIPSEDGASPPVVTTYEQPLPGPQGDAPAPAPATGSGGRTESALSPKEEEPSAAGEVPSRGASPLAVVKSEDEILSGPNAEAPAGGSGGWSLSLPSPKEEESSAAGEVPSGDASPPTDTNLESPVANPDGGYRNDLVPVEEDDLGAPVEDTAWYDSPGIDESYRLFLQHVRMVSDSKLLLEMDVKKILIGDWPSADNSEASDDDGDDEEEDAEEEEVKEEDDSMMAEEEEGYEEEEDDAMVDEDVNEEEVKEENMGFGSNGAIVNVREVEGVAQKVKDEVEATSFTRESAVRKKKRKGKKQKGNNENEEMNLGLGPDLRIVNALDFEMKKEVVEEEEDLWNALVMGIPEIEPLSWEASSSMGHHSAAPHPHNVSESEGAIWPPHINERPDSDFKRKLLKVLTRPFSLGEYGKLYATATSRTPLMKERRTRRRVVNYRWTHEMGKSYFDNYPDLAEQVEGSSLPNQLALLRGLFFWLKHVSHEDQFRPWSDDFKKYQIVPYMGEAYPQ